MENKNFKPTVFWAWNGEMEDSQICSQISEFAEAGIGGLHLHARAGLSIEYLGDAWLHAYRTAIEACKRYGVDVWIYDEQGWPSGFAGGKVNASGQDFLLKYLSLSRLSDKSKSDRLLAAYRKTEQGYHRTAQIENADLYIYFEVQEHYVDLLNPAVTQEFIRCTHEVYKKHFGQEFGKTIKGVFTDEPQIHVSSRAWSVELPALYRERYGEDVLDGLYLLFEEQGEAYQTFRYRYYSLVREMFVQNYTAQIGEWCEQNGLILTGHFAGEEGLCVQVASNTGVMPHYEFMRQPGIDHLGRRLNPLLLLKQVQSVAAQLEKKRILSETYACTGNGVSFRDLAWIWNYQAAFGVNMPCMSISMYRLGGVRKRDYPVFLSPQQPWWQEFAPFNRYLKNTSEFVSEGIYRADVLLISATDSALEEPICSVKQKNQSARYRRLAEDLVYLQIPYDIGDETILKRHAAVRGDSLIVGACSYGVVVLPELDNIELSTVELLERFSNAGGKIVCMTRLPSRVEGKIDEESLARLRSLGIEIIQQRRGIIEKYFARQSFQRKIWFCDESGKTTDALICNFRETQEGKNVVAFNPSAAARVKGMLCAKGYGQFYRFDAVSGKESELSTRWSQGFSYTECEIAAKDALYCRFRKSAAPVAFDIREECAKDVDFHLVHIEDNHCTLDFGRYRLNGEDYSPRMPLVKMLDEMYGRAETYGKECKISVEYTFECEETPSRLFLAAESEHAQEIMVNGKKLPCETAERFLDRDFRKYDIAPYVREGINTIVLVFTIRPLRLGFDLKTAHDAIRNKFSYPVEAESVYLIGDFSVQPKGAVTENISYIRTEDGFRLTRQKPLPSRGDLTSCGRWFYAGNAEYEFSFEKEAGKTFLRMEKYAGAAAAVLVNGKKAGLVFLPDDMMELTPYLGEGKNTVRIILLGTLRNLLGPHHHFKGEPEYTGVHTFTGEYGNGAIEDLSGEEAPDAVWTDSYNFIPFGIYRMKLIHQK